MTLKTLKTLKDFDPEPRCNGINQKELKNEAIKWIKAHDFIEDNIPDELAFTHEDDEFKAIQNWVEHFFNIKEKDLQ